ncbi:hypothetical protein BB561_002456 [Smittium simulii]|uniref:Tyr recombinase domain-containing protein n=1 Tax=Smittium simulii TaxID=133385 RepID=A0A2T9YQE4_9FUNG|nr:hypothetical protein BB561_002456 [Smittium simulii]
MFKEFMDYLNDTSIITANKNHFNIKKVMDYFNPSEKTEILNIKDLPANICWILAICGFLRASNIHRIDDARTKDKAAKALCPKPHANKKNLTINNLFKNIRDYNKQLSVNSIFRIIKSITIVGMNDNKARIPKARAVGATLAASTGISSDKIVKQANWSSYYTFDTYYRLTNNSISNIKSHSAQFVGMSCQQPPLNKAAFSTVKKADFIIYAIQLVLANMAIS